MILYKLIVNIKDNYMEKSYFSGALSYLSSFVSSPLTETATYPQEVSYPEVKALNVTTKENLDTIKRINELSKLIENHQYLLKINDEMLDEHADSHEDLFTESPASSVASSLKNNDEETSKSEENENTTVLEDLLSFSELRNSYHGGTYRSEIEKLASKKKPREDIPFSKSSEFNYPLRRKEISRNDKLLVKMESLRIFNKAIKKLTRSIENEKKEYDELLSQLKERVRLIPEQPNQNEPA